MRIVIPDDYPPVYGESPDALEPLRQHGEVKVFGTRAASREELLSRLADAEAVINVRAYTVFDAPLLDELPALRLISILGTGTDNVDLKAAAERGVVVTNTPGASTYSVAETAFALMFAAARHVALVDRKMREGEWFHKKGIELHGKTIGIVGLGAIGQAVAKMAHGLDMRVLVWSFRRDEERARALNVEMVELDELLRESDVVSLHLRSSPQAKGIIGRRELGLMKPRAILINTARGMLVDEQALAEALREGRIFAAGLDVYQQEPLPADSPLRGLDNVVLLPHSAWVTFEASQRLEQMPVDNILAYLRGEPTNVVNPAALDHPKQRR